MYQNSYYINIIAYITFYKSNDEHNHNPQIVAISPPNEINTKPTISRHISIQLRTIQVDKIMVNLYLDTSMASFYNTKSSKNKHTYNIIIIMVSKVN